MMVKKYKFDKKYPEHGFKVRIEIEDHLSVDVVTVSYVNENGNVAQTQETIENLINRYLIEMSQKGHIK